MVIIIKGGMGNQMFQYSFGYLKSKTSGRRLYVIDFTAWDSFPRGFALKCFGITPSKVSKALLIVFRFICLSFELLTKKFKFANKFYLQDMSDFESEANIAEHAFILDGYWQKANHFIQDREEIKKIFTFPPVPKIHNVVDFSGEKKLVAMHVRRGDYVSTSGDGGKHLVCNVDWYMHAIEVLRLNIDNFRLVIFSDDEKWVREQFGSLQEDVFVVPSNNQREPWIDLYLMSCCDHFILSNSTFSWWAAFLGETNSSSVIAPKYWFKGVKTESIGICPTHWDLI